MSNEQQDIKQKLIRFDNEKEKSKLTRIYQNELIEAVERGENVVCKTVPREYDVEMIDAMFKADISFIANRGDHNYLTIYTLERYADDFLTIQSEVFKTDTVQDNENQKQYELEHECDYDDR